MDSLVRDKVTKHELRRENQSPVERQISVGRTVSPFGPLSHDDQLQGQSPFLPSRRRSQRALQRPLFQSKVPNPREK